MSKPPIVTSYERPPFPPDNFDWIAYREGHAKGPQGWGPTEAAAITDLLAHEEDDEGSD